MSNSALTEYSVNIRGTEPDQHLCYASGMQTDAGALDHKTLREIIKRALSQAQEGERPAAVAWVLGVHIRTTFRWLSLYRAGGAENLDADKRGGRPPKLDHNDLKWIDDKVTFDNTLCPASQGEWPGKPTK
jgi:hypothetical protein